MAGGGLCACLLFLAQGDALQAVEIGGGGSDEQQIVRVVEAVSPAVVFIDGRRIVEQKRAETKQKMQGSGVIIDTEGYILTSAHLLEKAGPATATLHDGRILTAKMAGFRALAASSRLRGSSGLGL